MEVKTGIKELQKTWNLVNNPVQNSARPNQITHQNRTCSICCRIWSMLKDVIHSAWLLYWHLEWTMLSQVWLKGSKSSLTDVELRKLRHFGRVEPFHTVFYGMNLLRWMCCVIGQKILGMFYVEMRSDSNADTNASTRPLLLFLYLYLRSAYPTQWEIFHICDSSLNIYEDSQMAAAPWHQIALCPSRWPRRWPTCNSP